MDTALFDSDIQAFVVGALKRDDLLKSVIYSPQYRYILTALVALPIYLHT